MGWVPGCILCKRGGYALGIGGEGGSGGKSYGCWEQVLCGAGVEMYALGAGMRFWKLGLGAGAEGDGWGGCAFEDGKGDLLWG